MILVMYFLGLVSLDNAVAFLYVIGISMLVAEFGIVSFGILAFNGLLALYAAYSLQSGDSLIFGAPVGWDIIFGIAFVEALCVGGGFAIFNLLKKQKTTTGTEGMIGAKALVMEWHADKGSVCIDGEVWKARATHRLDLKANDEVFVQSVDKLVLIVKP